MRLLGLMLTLLLPLLPAADSEADRHLREHAGDWYDRSADTWQPVTLDEQPRETEHGEGMANLVVDIATLVMWVVIIAAIIAIIIWLVHVLRPAHRPGPSERPRPTVTAAQTDLSQLPFDPGVADDPEVGLRQALDAGDWRRAVMWLFACQLVLLDRAGLIHLRRDTTNRGYLRAMQKHDRALRQALAQTITAFEHTYFGGQNLSQTTMDQLLAGDRQLRAQLASQEPSA